MKEEWKEYKLGDVSTFSQGIQVDIDNQYSEYKPGRVRFIRIVDFTKNGEPLRYIDKPRDKYLTADGDIVMIRYGSQTAGLVAKSYDGAIANNIFKIEFNNDVISNEFGYYYLSQKSIFDYLRGAQSSSTMPAITFEIAGRVPLCLPTINIQNDIVSILKSLDDKIEVNRKINENLEQQAQALFKSWFVDFEPFKNGEFVKSELGMIPKGWRVGTIGEYCKVRSGFAFKSTWWTNEGVPVIKIKNITDNGNLEMLDCSFVSKEHAALAKEFQTIEGDLLIAMTGATIGKFCIVNSSESYCVNQRVGKFFLGQNPLEKLPFIYCCLKRNTIYDEIVNRGQGSAQPNISGKDIETIKIAYPSKDVLDDFNNITKATFELIVNNEAESRRLAELRDALLPKLMSGEIKVEDVTL